MTREEMKELKGLAASMGLYDDKNPCKRAVILGKAIKALEQEPCEDAVSRQTVLDEISDYNNDIDYTTNELYDRIKRMPPVNPQPKTGQFAKWVATEIFDENWEYNKDAFAEIACRKLAKLGIVRAKGDEWELIEPQESEDEG